MTLSNCTTLSGDNDRDGSNYYEVTMGVAIKPFPNDKFLSRWLLRPAFRYDRCSKPVFNSGDRNQWTFSRDVPFTFWGCGNNPVRARENKMGGRNDEKD